MSNAANRNAVDETPQTRERILDSAERLFAERGFGASIRDITSAAGANIAAVNYYFRSKEGLYNEAMLRLMQIHRDRRLGVIRDVMSRPNGSVRTEDMLRAFAAAVVQPDRDGDLGRILMRLMHREIAEPHLPPEMGFKEILRPVEGALASALASLEPGLDEKDAAWCVQSFFAQLLWVNQVAILFFDPENRSKVPFSVQEMVDHIVRFTASGIRAAAHSNSSAA